LQGHSNEFANINSIYIFWEENDVRVNYVVAVHSGCWNVVRVSIFFGL